MDQRRLLPSVDRVLASIDAPELPHALQVSCARSALDAARARVERGNDPRNGTDTHGVVADAQRRCDELTAALLQRVINATGVLLHTNLGRAPIDGSSLDAAIPTASGYSNLEYRMTDGERGSRHEHAGRLLAVASGAEAGMVVNNNAAAVLLVLAALARDRDVIVSRGELVEIGGGFRVPDVLAESGARLIEVGTTNRTRIADYERALTESTAMLLKVHASNYHMTGFVGAVGVEELVELGFPVVIDAGSGLLDATTPWLDVRPHWLHDEPGVRQCIASGAALVTFSGDKLLGGPQAGVIVGSADLVARCARHPLARAVRADKVTLAVLQHVALAYLAGEAATIPFWRMATTPRAALRERAEAIAAAVPGAKVVDTDAVPGGGSVPGTTIPSVGVSFDVDRPDAALGELRRERVIARIDRDRIVLDLRTVEPADDTALVRALANTIA